MSSIKKNQDQDLLGITFRGSKTSVNYTKRPTIKLDKNGVLLYKIPYTDKFEYYPIFIARYSLGNLEMYLDTGDEKYKKIFFNNADWLLQNLVIKDDFAVWEHHYKLPFYEFKKIPWVHGLGQGLGMTVLLKAYQITKNTNYFKASEKVLNSLEIDIQDGGIKFIDENGDTWLEEYALLPPPHVLNGFITILFSTHEFHKVTGNEKALDLWNKGIKTLKSNLEKYETGYWSFYDLLRKCPSTKNYHKMHIWQLNVLYELTKEKMFQDYAKKWENYNKKIINKKLVSLNRGISHLRRYGLNDCIDRYFKRKKWDK